MHLFAVLSPKVSSAGIAFTLLILATQALSKQPTLIFDSIQKLINRYIIVIIKSKQKIGCVPDINLLQIFHKIVNSYLEEAKDHAFLKANGDHYYEGVE